MFALLTSTSFPVCPTQPPATPVPLALPPPLPSPRFSFPLHVFFPGRHAQQIEQRHTMPPKKAKTGATPIKPAPLIETPASVTTNRGKEIQTTAAAGRSRRATVLPAIRESPAATKANAKATDEDGEEVEEPIEPPKKRGRPAKAKAAERTEAVRSVASTLKRGSGRPKRAVAALAVPEEEDGPPFTRHKAPFGGETTVVHEDEEAAADQLEGEMLETASDPADATTRKRKASAVIARQGKGTGTKKAVVNNDDAENATSATPLDRSYWLMKAEQEDRFETTRGGEVINTRFTIADLQSKTAPEPWDGVRNAVAARNMRAMRTGDLAFFYASGGKSGRKPGITGIMEIVAEATRDMTVDDENAYGYVENTSAREKWVVVHVEHRKTLSKPVHLAELQKYKNGVLEHMELLHQSRLSVSEVREEEWNFIVDKLITGYATDQAGDNKELDVVDKEGGELDDPKSKAGHPIISNDDHATANEASLITDSGNGYRSSSVVLPSVETESSNTKGKRADTAVEASGQASRATSRQSSKAVSAGSVTAANLDANRVSSRRSSRAASLAPKAIQDEETIKTTDRGASRTSTRQASRAPSAGPAVATTTQPPAAHTSRGGSRGRSRTPKVTGLNAKGAVHDGANLASVMEE
nr:thymocyte nuclear protein 1 [Quercus suber]